MHKRKKSNRPKRKTYIPRIYRVCFCLYEMQVVKGVKTSGKGVDHEPFKGVLHLLSKISMFCALFQNNQQLCEK